MLVASLHLAVLLKDLSGYIIWCPAHLMGCNAQLLTIDSIVAVPDLPTLDQ